MQEIKLQPGHVLRNSMTLPCWGLPCFRASLHLQHQVWKRWFHLLQIISDISTVKPPSRWIPNVSLWIPMAIWRRPHFRTQAELNFSVSLGSKNSKQLTATDRCLTNCRQRKARQKAARFDRHQYALVLLHIMPWHLGNAKCPWLHLPGDFVIFHINGLV